MRDPSVELSDVLVWEKLSIFLNDFLFGQLVPSAVF